MSIQHYNVMRESKDPKQLRYQMVISAEKVGIKETARCFHTSRNTVRKRYRRWRSQGYKGLEDLSRRPKHSPMATPDEERRYIVELKHKYKRLGREQIKIIEGLSRSPRTIRKIWREEGVSSRKRPKKYKKKQNLRHFKKEWKFLQMIVEDTKDLHDIPEYYPQMKALKLPTVQYTARDVSTGMLLMRFAQERSLTNSTLSANYLNHMLSTSGINLSHTTRQTDNGSEYIGSATAKRPSAYTICVQEIPGQKHSRIPPGAHTWQADIETVHNLVEMEFYELEHFSSRTDSLTKARSYQLFFSRPNSYKEGKTIPTG